MQSNRILLSSVKNQNQLLVSSPFICILSGGILAKGLGKTVETLSLILLNRCQGNEIGVEVAVVEMKKAEEDDDHEASIKRKKYSHTEFKCICV